MIVDCQKTPGPTGDFILLELFDVMAEEIIESIVIFFLNKNHNNYCKNLKFFSWKTIQKSTFPWLLHSHCPFHKMKMSETRLKTLSSKKIKIETTLLSIFCKKKHSDLVTSLFWCKGKSFGAISSSRIMFFAHSWGHVTSMQISKEASEHFLKILLYYLITLLWNKIGAQLMIVFDLKRHYILIYPVFYHQKRNWIFNPRFGYW